MFGYHYLNNISDKGTALWTDDYQYTENAQQAEALLVRSAAMHDMEFSPELLAVARAGAGVNNIPLDRCAQEGIVVFNTPGANANAVVELALCGMLLGSRDIVGGINWVQSIKDTEGVGKQVEKGKSKFGMNVYGCDPYISIDAAWHLDSSIIPVKTRDDIYANCDIITLHVPLVDDTKKMINKQAISKMRDGVIILNFARDLLVDDDAMEEALKSGKVARYITDFPNDKTAGMAGVVAIPHLGASTEEAEDNCARMAVRQVMNYLENGNIVNSVNYPNCDMGRCTKAARITILHQNIPNTLSPFTSVFAKRNINISDLMNRSRGDYAYTMLDLDSVPPADAIEELRSIHGVLRVRQIG